MQILSLPSGPTGQLNLAATIASAITTQSHPPPCSWWTSRVSRMLRTSTRRACRNSGSSWSTPQGRLTRFTIQTRVRLQVAEPWSSARNQSSRARKKWNVQTICYRMSRWAGILIPRVAANEAFRERLRFSKRVNRTWITSAERLRRRMLCLIRDIPLPSQCSDRLTRIANNFWLIQSISKRSTITLFLHPVAS